MDALVKAFWGTLDTANAPIDNPTLLNKGWTISHQHEKLSCLHKPTLYTLLCAPKTKAYWVDHCKQLTATAFDKVDWTITGDAVRSLWISTAIGSPNTSPVFVVSGKCRKSTGKQTHSDCPPCGKYEGAPHVMQCHIPGAATECWLILLSQLNGWLASKDTQPELRFLIIKTTMTNWHNGLAPLLTSTAMPSLNPLLLSQDKISCYNFLLGRISHLWAETQQAYLTLLGKRNTGRGWAILLIFKLLEIAWDQ
jgi:hypothetical protein